MTAEIEKNCPACGNDADCAGDCLASMFVEKEDAREGIVVYIQR